MDLPKHYLPNKTRIMRQLSRLSLTAVVASWREKSSNGRLRDSVEFKPSSTSTIRGAGTSRTLSRASITPSTTTSVRMGLGSSNRPSTSSSRRITKIHTSLQKTSSCHLSKMDSQINKLINADKSTSGSSLRIRLSLSTPRSRSRS